MSAISPSDYAEILGEYLRTHGEEALYRASVLSQACIETGLGPEDIIALHFEALDRHLATRAARDQVHAHGDAQQFLLEVMIAYGVKYKEYLELRLRESLRDAEAQAVRARERASEAERIQREKDEILRVIAHELRTPITAAQGNLDLASHVLRRGEVGPVTQLLVRAREALERISRLSADLVEASRGHPPHIELVPMDLGPIVAQACEWVRPAAASKGVALAYTHDGPALTVQANTDALLSAFGNLLSNAVRYTPTGGRVQVQSGGDTEHAWIVVRDSGIGMTPEVQARIFEKFYRGPEARMMEATGLGLGLALVQQMIAAHGGAIDIESVPGQGSTFRVILPLGAMMDQEDRDGGHDFSGWPGGPHSAAAPDH